MKSNTQITCVSVVFEIYRESKCKECKEQTVHEKDRNYNHYDTEKQQTRPNRFIY